MTCDFAIVERLDVHDVVASYQRLYAQGRHGKNQATSASVSRDSTPAGAPPSRPAPPFTPGGAAQARHT